MNLPLYPSISISLIQKDLYLEWSGSFGQGGRFSVLLNHGYLSGPTTKKRFFRLPLSEFLKIIRKRREIQVGYGFGYLNIVGCKNKFTRVIDITFTIELNITFISIQLQKFIYRHLSGHLSLLHIQCLVMAGQLFPFSAIQLNSVSLKIAAPSSSM